MYDIKPKKSFKSYIKSAKKPELIRETNENKQLEPRHFSYWRNHDVIKTTPLPPVQESKQETLVKTVRFER